jgi:LPXTG-motif cell wall-anchored protein
LRISPRWGGAELAAFLVERNVYMSNMAWIVVIVLVVLFLGGGGFYLRRR